MTTNIASNSSLATQLKKEIKYSGGGVFSKVLVKTNNSQSTLFCLASGTDISEHTSPKNATITVIDGKGILTLEGQEIKLEFGVFVFMPANSPHALKAEENLAFLLTLSENN